MEGKVRARLGWWGYCSESWVPPLYLGEKKKRERKKVCASPNMLEGTSICEICLYAVKYTINLSGAGSGTGRL